MSFWDSKKMLQWRSSMHLTWYLLPTHHDLSRPHSHLLIITSCVRFTCKSLLLDHKAIDDPVAYVRWWWKTKRDTLTCGGGVETGNEWYPALWTLEVEDTVLWPLVTDLGYAERRRDLHPLTTDHHWWRVAPLQTGKGQPLPGALQHWTRKPHCHVRL